MMNDKLDEMATPIPDYLQVMLLVKTDQISAFEEYAWAIGVLSFTILEGSDAPPIFEPAPGEVILWQQLFSPVQLLFPADIHHRDLHHKDTHRHQIEILLENGKNDFGFEFKEVHFEVLMPREWEREWLKDYKPIHFFQVDVPVDAMIPCFSIFPTHLLPTPTPAHPFIVMDPGLAFGTGTHPTTAMCLHWLSQQNLTNKNILDFGCGSGILGLSAIKLGARSASLLDHDPLALTASQNNASRNHLTNADISYFLPNELPNHQTFDIVIANIFSRVLMDLRDTLLSHLSPNGQLLLSGVLAQQENELYEHYVNECVNEGGAKGGILLQKINEQDQWCLLLGTLIGKNNHQNK